MKKGYALSLLFVFISITAFSQRRFTEKTGWWPAIEGGYLRQGDQHRMEANYYHHRIKKWMIENKDSTEDKTASLSWGPTAGLIGFVTDDNTFRMGQQVGFSMVYNNVEYLLPVGLKAGVYLENYTKKDQRISFTGGPLIGGFIHCQYGYSIPLGKQTIPGIGRHRLGVFIYLNSLGIVEFLERTPMM